MEMDTKQSEKSSRPQETSKYTKTWTEEEKMRLHQSLVLHGPLDVQKLAECVITKSENQITDLIDSTIRHFKKNQALEINNHHEPGSMYKIKKFPNGKNRPANKVYLDKWLDTLNDYNLSDDPHFNPLAFVLKLISKYSKTLPCREAGSTAIDHRAAYLYLSHATRSFMGPKMNEHTNRLLQDALMNLAHDHTNNSVYDKEEEFIENINVDAVLTRPKNTVPMNKGRTQVSALQEIRMNELLNPLNVPYEMLDSSGEI